MAPATSALRVMVAAANWVPIPSITKPEMLRIIILDIIEFEVRAKVEHTDFANQSDSGSRSAGIFVDKRSVSLDLTIHQKVSFAGILRRIV